MGELHWTQLRDNDFTEMLKKKNSEPLVHPHPDAKNHPAYLKAIDSSKAIICTGPAGTGKTYMACGKAIEHLRMGKISKIVLSRPLQECGGRIGAVPGDVFDKVVDMMVPLIESLEEFTSPAEVEKMLEEGTLMIVPLEKMRGRTMKGAFVILDEAQNATFTQLKMLLTRFGTKEGSETKMVVCGDYTQSDLPYVGHNSLWELVERFHAMPNWHPAVSHIVLTKDDIVRDELVRWFVEATEGHFVQKVRDEQKGDASYSAIPCPECDSDIWYPKSMELDIDAPLLKCHSCNEFIELTDSSGRLSPLVVEPRNKKDESLAVIGLPNVPKVASK